jgi:predicted nucleic acid-binding protein
VIILDTNVLSELMRPRVAAPVAAWAASRAASSLYVTTTTQAEILYGIALLPAGRRRGAIASAAATMFDVEFAGRVLPFGSEAASMYARIAADRRLAGVPISSFDAQIAAIARVTGAKIATRNVRDFESCGVDLLDPWAA